MLKVMLSSLEAIRMGVLRWLFAAIECECVEIEEASSSNCAECAGERASLMYDRAHIKYN